MLVVSTSRWLRQAAEVPLQFPATDRTGSIPRMHPGSWHSLHALSLPAFPSRTLAVYPLLRWPICLIHRPRNVKVYAHYWREPHQLNFVLRLQIEQKFDWPAARTPHSFVHGKLRLSIIREGFRTANMAQELVLSLSSPGVHVHAREWRCELRRCEWPQNSLFCRCIYRTHKLIGITIPHFPNCDQRVGASTTGISRRRLVTMGTQGVVNSCTTMDRMLYSLLHGAPKAADWTTIFSPTHDYYYLFIIYFTTQLLAIAITARCQRYDFILTSLPVAHIQDSRWSTSLWSPCNEQSLSMWMTHLLTPVM